MAERRRNLKGARGQYELLASVSRDDISEYHLAINQSVPGDDRWVIVRETLPRVADDQGLTRRFLDDLRVTSRFDHPNLVRVFETGRTKRSYFSILEFLLGDGLGRLVQEALRTGKDMGPALAAVLVAQVCDGLEHAHRVRDGKGDPLNPIHHNIHPNNVVVLYSGRVKLIGFDIQRTALQIQNGPARGEVAYASPEQCENKPLDAGTDIFSLGIVLWELLARRSLFKAQTKSDTLLAVKAAEIPPIGGQERGVTGELEAVAIRALQRNPRSRFQSAAQMGDALRACLRQSRQKVDEFDIGAFVRSVLGAREEQKRRLLDKVMSDPISQADVSRLVPDTRTVPVWIGKAGRPSRSIEPPALEHKPLAKKKPAPAPEEKEKPTADKKPEPSIRISMPGKKPGRRASRWPLVLGLLSAVAIAVVIVVVAWPSGDDDQTPSGPEVSEPVAPPPDQPEPAKPEPEPEPVKPEPEPEPAEPAPALLDIESTPSGCTVRLDKRKLPQKTPLDSVSVEPGRELAVTVLCPGHKRETRLVTPEAGERLSLAFAPPRAPRSTHGFLHLNSMPWTEVYLGKRKLGVTPLLGKKLPKGRHRLRMVNKKAGIDETVVVIIRPGKKTSLLKKFNQ